MALRDLVIRPQTKALQYSSGVFDELRLRFADIMDRRDVSEEIYKMAALGRARALSARVSIEHAIEEALGGSAGGRP